VKICGLFLEAPLVLQRIPLFFGGMQSSLFRTLTSRPFPHAFGHVPTYTPPRIAHSASSHFLPSPFTFTPNSLLFMGLRVKVLDFLVLRRWRLMGWSLHQ